MFELIDIFIEYKNINLILAFRFLNKQLKNYVDNNYIWTEKLEEILSEYKKFKERIYSSALNVYISKTHEVFEIISDYEKCVRNTYDSKYDSYLNIKKSIQPINEEQKAILYNLFFTDCKVIDIEGNISSYSKSFFDPKEIEYIRFFAREQDEEYSETRSYIKIMFFQNKVFRYLVITCYNFIYDSSGIRSYILDIVEI